MSYWVRMSLVKINPWLESSEKYSLFRFLIMNETETLPRDNSHEE